MSESPSVSGIGLSRDSRKQPIADGDCDTDFDGDSESPGRCGAGDEVDADIAVSTFWFHEAADME